MGNNQTNYVWAYVGINLIDTHMHIQTHINIDFTNIEHCLYSCAGVIVGLLGFAWLYLALLGYSILWKSTRAH